MKTFFKINPFGRLRINAEQSRSIKIFLLITFLVFTFFSFGIIKAGEEHNVSGWIWSDNIGWISFNNTTDGSSYNYGVNIDLSTGLFSGYAWSDNVGWITFNETELTGCPSGSCRAELNFSTNEVSGWARTVNTGDGWDGWISLRGVAQDLSTYGVFLNSSTNELEYWAWSDDFGWISFNCDTDPSCVGSIYGAYLDFNNPPTAAFSCDPDLATCGTSGCTGYTGCLFRLENQSTDDDGQDDIASSTWVITGPTSERITCTLNPLCDWPLQPIHPAGIYTATLKVEDQSGAEHTSAPQNFTIYREAIADFMCSFKEDGPWQPCQNFKLLEGEVIYFSDDSEASEGGGSITQRTWEFKGGEPNSILGNETMASTTFIYTADPEFGKAILTVQDQTGRTNTITYNLLMTAPSPEWKEVPPF